MGIARSKSGSVCWLVLIFVLSVLVVQAQTERGRGSGPKQKPEKSCPENAFQTEVLSAEVVEGGCIDYVFQVMYTASCRYELSHFTVDVPCGEVEALSNSENWKQEIGKDPTTGLNGFKIDDIQSFGKGSISSFTVSVRICGGDSCTDTIGLVSYKAGQCVEYDTLEYDITGGSDDNPTDPGDEDDPGDDETCSILLASLSQQNATCFNGKNGEISAVIEEGIAPFEYHWSTGMSDTEVLGNLAAGVYSVTIIDAEGNTLTLHTEVTQPAGISIIGNVVQPSCFGSLNGSINLEVTGGNGGYSYLWSTGSTQQSVNSLGAGFYAVMITDVMGCQSQESFILTNSVQLNATANIVAASCGQSNGAIDLSVSGGSAPYSFAWSNGAATEDLANAAAGSYYVTITDANGCQRVASYTIQQTTPIRLTYEVTPADCFGGPTGSIRLTASGGAEPYSIQWNNGLTAENIDGLPSGTYRVTVTDNNGCVAMATVFVPKVFIPLTSQIEQPSCSNDGIGSVTITPIDDTMTYTYEWSNGDVDNTLTAGSGTYTLTLSSSDGCTSTFSFTLLAPTPIMADAVVDSDQCGTDGSFSIDLTVNGGMAPYQYAWSNGASAEDLVNLSAGVYNVVITDANGCVVEKEVLVNSDVFQWTCLIDAPMSDFTCNSAGNSLSTAVQDASFYSWTVSSSDGSWAITSGSNQPNVIFTAGTPGSDAQFTLTILKNGCVQTCTYEVVGSCLERDNTGGGDPGDEMPCEVTTEIVQEPSIDPTGEEVTLVEEIEDDQNLDSINVIEVESEGIAIVDSEEEEAYENVAEELVVALDSMIVEIVEDDEWVVENGVDVEADNLTPTEPTAFMFSAYPNPFVNDLTVQWTADANEHVVIEILDQFGRRIANVFSGEVERGQSYDIEWSSPQSDDRFYYYRYSSVHKKRYGKLLRR